MLGFAAPAAGTGQSAFLPAPCPLWKLAIIPAVVATPAPPLQLLSQPALLGNVPVAHVVILVVSAARLRSTRAPPFAQL